MRKRTKEHSGIPSAGKGAKPECPPELIQDQGAALEVVDLSVPLQPQEMSRLVAEFDWAATPLGPMADWPDSLKAAVRILLTSGFPMWMAWGPDLTILYNDGYRRTTLGKKHPWALGRSAREVWSEIWEDIGPRIERVLETGQASWDEALMLILERSGYSEETYHTFSYSPLSGPGDEIAGMLCVVIEDTDRVIAERQVSSLSTLAAALNVSTTRQEVFAAIESGLARQKDMPCTLTYLFAGEEDQLHLVARTGVGPEHAAATLTIDINVETEAWPIRQVLEKRRSVTVDHLRELFPDLPHGCWDRPPERAQLVPIARRGQDKPVGIFIAALNPYRQVDQSYASFLDLIAGQIAAAITNAQAYEEAKTRAEGLQELDRAKTAFFSNISHELRTPLTLILGPVEDALASQAPPSPDALEMLHRNALRLLKLVNGVLDFVRIEVGRLQANYQATDLSLLTAQLASVFRSAIERAGLNLVVECPPLPEPVYIDREMWEKIVLNLLSNALKSTFEGEIRVSVRAADGADVSVSDTGTGIAEADLPHLFERFRRIDGARRRSHEGSGIGLALVQELVLLHGGSIEVSSKEGQGTTFRIHLPFGHHHLAVEKIAGPDLTPVAVQGSAVAYVQEAMGWLPGDGHLKGEIQPGSGIEDSSLGASADGKPVVLLVDDNADMREYVFGLLNGRFRVMTAENGKVALELAEKARPNLILTDVMMPEMDGFAVLNELRSNPSTRTVPVIMLSARAGEEARIEGLGAGADDYLTKPFTARELVARVEAQLKMARLRQEATEQEAALTRELDRVKQFAWKALEHIPDLFATLDGHFNVTYWNAAAAETAARAGNHDLGMSLWDLYPGIRGTEIESNLRWVMTQRIPREFEYNPIPDVWFQFRAFPMPEDGIIMYVRNTSDARKAEHVLRRSEQLAATGRLAASIAHEINNPLEAVTNLLFLAKLDSSVTGETKNLLDMADKELQRLSHIAARSLKFYRQRTAPAPTQIEELLESVLFFYERDIKARNVTLKKRYRSAPPVLCQPGEIQQVLTNMFGNALDALSKPGRMIVRVRPARDSSGRDGVAVTVADTGEGMDKATRSRLFHPFVTTKGEEGTGLGLWVSKGIIDKHQGTISVRSQAGQGTVFRFFLPLDTSLPDAN